MRVLALLVALLALPATALAAPGDVPAQRTLVVVGQSGTGPADALEAATGIAPAGAMWYLGLHESEAVVGAVLDDIRTQVVARPGLVVNLGVSFGSVSTPTAPQTSLIAAGVHDARIAQLATFLKTLPTVAYLRLGYEFDLLGGQYGAPRVYKLAYRRVVDRLRAAGVSNASYVWHSAGAFWRAADPSLFAVRSGAVAVAARQTLKPPLPSDALPIAEWFPGRGYVDAFGISYWQDSCCFGRSEPAARAVYEARTREILGEARAMGLPLHISESTPAYIGADSGAESVAWLDRTFALIDDFDIAMWSLIAIDWREGGFFAAPFWNGYWPDARIGAFRTTRERYVAGVSTPRFLHRSADLPAQLGF